MIVASSWEIVLTMNSESHAAIVAACRNTQGGIPVRSCALRAGVNLKRP